MSDNTSVAVSCPEILTHSDALVQEVESGDQALSDGVDHQTGTEKVAVEAEEGPETLQSMAACDEEDTVESRSEASPRCGWPVVVDQMSLEEKSNSENSEGILSFGEVRETCEVYDEKVEIHTDGKVEEGGECARSERACVDKGRQRQQQRCEEELKETVEFVGSKRSSSSLVVDENGGSRDDRKKTRDRRRGGSVRTDRTQNSKANATLAKKGSRRSSEKRSASRSGVVEVEKSETPVLRDAKEALEGEEAESGCLVKELINLNVSCCDDTARLEFPEVGSRWTEESSLNEAVVKVGGREAGEPIESEVADERIEGESEKLDDDGASEEQRKVVSASDESGGREEESAREATSGSSSELMVEEKGNSEASAFDRIVSELSRSSAELAVKVNQMNAFIESMRRLGLENTVSLSRSESALLSEVHALRMALTVLHVDLEGLEKKVVLTDEVEASGCDLQAMKKVELVEMLKGSKQEVKALRVENTEIKGAMIHLSTTIRGDEFASRLMNMTPSLSASSPQMGCVPPPPDPAMLQLGASARMEGRCASPHSVPLRVRPKVPMKGLHWSKIPIQQVNQTVFAKVDPQRVYLESNALETNFRVRTSKTLHKMLTRTRKLSFVDSKRCLNVGIFLQTLKFPYLKVIGAITSLDAKIMTSELTRKLQDCLPTDEEVKSIGNYVATGGSLERLQVVDQFFHSIAGIPQFRARLKVYEYKVNYDLRACELEIAMSRLDSANQDLKKNTSTWIRLLEVVLAIGNFLNYNTPRGGARGFQLTCLSQLSSIKNLDNTLTLLDYLVGYFHEMDQYGDVLDLPNASRSIAQAAKLDWNTVINDLLYLRKQLSDMLMLLMTIKRLNSGSDRFFDTIPLALKAIERKLDGLEVQFNQTCNQYKEIAKEYGVSSQSTSPCEFYGMIYSFLNLLENAVERHKVKSTNALKKESESCFFKKGSIRKKIIQKELELSYATADNSGFVSSTSTQGDDDSGIRCSTR